MKKSDLPPVWIDETVKQFFTTYVLGKRNHPEIWHRKLMPLPRLLLLYGVAKNNMTKSILELCEDNKIPFHVCILEKNPKVSSEIISGIEHNRGQLLILHNVQYISTVARAAHLEELFPHFEMIIAVSSECPGSEEDYFWGQFLPEFRYRKTLPSLDFRKELFRWYAEAWANHAKMPVQLSDADILNLTICADYCTPNNVKRFMRRVFWAAWNEKPAVIDYEFMKPYLYKLYADVDDIFSIVKHDACRLYSTYEPEKKEEEEQPQRKRQRSEEEEQAPVAGLY